MEAVQDTGTVVAMWDAAQRAERSFPAFLTRRGRDWHAVGWAEAGEQVDRLAGGLLASGVAHGDRVGILVGTCPEWTVCDYALQSIGAVPVPLYATSSTSDAAHVLADSGARMLI
ncbi:MAG: AMP-binding protein, partial [Gaiellales bacterium]